MGQEFSALVRDNEAAPHGETGHGRPVAQPYLQPANYLLIGAALLIGAIVIGTAFLVANFRERALNDSERELKNTVLILSEQIDRSFQAIELVQRSVVDRTGALRDSADFTARMGSDDVHAMLQDKISGLTQVDAIALVNADGMIVNASRDNHPPRDVSVVDRSYFRTLKSNPTLDRNVSVP